MVHTPTKEREAAPSTTPTPALFPIAYEWPRCPQGCGLGASCRCVIAGHPYCPGCYQPDAYGPLKTFCPVCWRAYIRRRPDARE